MSKHRIFPAFLLLSAWLASAARSANEGNPSEHAETVDTGSVERLEYDIRWHFLSVGSASIETMELSAGGTNTTVRRLHVRNHPWARILYRMEDRIESVEKETGDSRVTHVTKQVREGRFRQDDELVIDYVAGSAKWRDKVSGVSAEYLVPEGIHDYVSTLAAIRAKGCLPLGQTNSYRLAMDKGIHEIVLTSSATSSMRSASRMVSATALTVQSKSPDLCVRNVPGAIWVGLDPPAIIAMDLATKIGTVRAALTKWELDGKTVEWQNTVVKGGQGHEGESNSGSLVSDLGSKGTWGDFPGRPDSSRGSDDP
jgi:hypothetical protein